MPTILLFTANDPDQRLLQLSREGKEIQRLLNSVPGRDYDIVLVPDATVPDIIEELKVPDREVEIIHYAGHAGPDQLRLTDGDVEAQALAEKLRNLRTVKLVFLNGCATRAQVQFFHAAGIPFIVATRRKVEDERAFWVAFQFYQYLTLGRSLREAYNEVVIDNQKLRKHVVFASERTLAPRSGAEKPDDMPELAWGLYDRDEDQAADYSLPLRRRQPPGVDQVSHTPFLKKLVLSLEEIERPDFAEVRTLAQSIQRRGAPDGSMKDVLNKVLPLTLGIRLQQITALPDDFSGEYYRQLLYDYVFFFETLLHHTAAFLFARLWNEYRNGQVPLPEVARNLLHTNQTAAPPDIFSPAILALKQRITSESLPMDIPADSSLWSYLASSAFQEASDFFFLQKQYYWQRARRKPNEALESCLLSQQHLMTAFPHFVPIVRHTMVAVHHIHVTKLRYVPEEYDNLVSHLTFSVRSPRQQQEKNPMENHSILCFDLPRHEYVPTTPSLNLFPFIIDRNIFSNTKQEVDLYLFSGYFPSRAGGRPHYHFTSVRDPGKIWCFDEEDEAPTTLHLGDSTSPIHTANHLMIEPEELRYFLKKFSDQLLKPSSHAR